MKNTITCFMFLIVACFITVKVNAQKTSAADSVYRMLDTAMHIMQKKGLHAEKVNWKKLRNELRKQTSKVQTVKEAAFAFTRLFDVLQDVHGAFFYIDTVFRSTGKVLNADKINQVTNDELRKGPRLYATMLNTDIAYIRIPFINAQDSASVYKIANRISDSVLAMLKNKPKGLIVDLRLNQGGNMYPMIAGLRSLYNEGLVSEAYSYEHGHKGEAVVFRNDSLISGYFKIKLNRVEDFSALPVAVLIGPSTASAGECTAASLTFRKNSILIGEESMGLTTGNDGFLLMPDIGFNLAVSVLKDGSGKILYDCIRPAITVPGGDNFTELTSDAKVAKAAEWIMKQSK